MWRIVILLAWALTVESYDRDIYETVEHGTQLKIFMSKDVDKLEFVPADDPKKLKLYYDKSSHRTNKGKVSGSSQDRRWYLDEVTYEDEGTYIKKNYWNHEISVVKVAVKPRRVTKKCVAGENLHIRMEGAKGSQASLFFSGVAGNITLLRHGAIKTDDLPEYRGRIDPSFWNIIIKNVNTSDEGIYVLRDQKDRVVSVTRMELVDHHEVINGSPLLALLLLLGIPAGVCCCCRKKIFKKANTAATLQSSQETTHPPPTGPVGPCPPYDQPQQPGGVYYPGPDLNMGPTVHFPPQPSDPGPWTGPPPSPGFNPAYPPQNPAYPSAGSAQPPQWSGPPPGQYPPGPTTPMGYAPVMYSSAPPASASEPVKEELKMDNMTASPADPLLPEKPQGDTGSTPPEPPSSNTVPGSTDGAYQFQIDVVCRWWSDE
ncbi:uncharacterized protein KZ484_024129 isoform 2-T3 [Pholidichthys leucotaenia]